MRVLYVISASALHLLILFSHVATNGPTCCVKIQPCWRNPIFCDNFFGHVVSTWIYKYHDSFCLVRIQTMLNQFITQKIDQCRKYLLNLSLPSVLISKPKNEHLFSKHMLASSLKTAANRVLENHLKINGCTTGFPGRVCYEQCLGWMGYKPNIFHLQVG